MSVDRWILCSSKTSVNQFRSKIVKRFVAQMLSHPTFPFTVQEPRDQEMGEFYVVKKCLATDFEAPKLQKCQLANLFEGAH